MLGQEALHGRPLHAFAFAVDEAQVQDRCRAAGVNVRLHRAHHIARRKGVQVERAVDGELHFVVSAQPISRNAETVARPCDREAAVRVSSASTVWQTGAVKVGWEEVRALRLARHHLHERAPRGSELRVVSRICGLHAQLFSSAALSLWARVEGATLAGLRRALWEEGTLVKSWAMRGTLHLLPARDLPVYLGALSTYRHYLTQGWVKYFGLTREEIELVIATVGKVLRGRVLTRAQLADAVVERTGARKLGAVLRQGWGVLLKPCAYRGQLCFAEGEGARVRFTHPGPMRQLEPERALAEVARRYLGAYAPATRDDFALWWQGTTRTQAQRLLESLDVTAVDLAGTRAYLLAADASPPPLARSVRLLPAFDPYVVGAPRSGGLFPAAHKARVFRPQGWISPVLLVDGHAEGVWRHERKNGRLQVRIEPFAALSRRARAQASEEAARLAVFLDARLDKVVFA